ASRHDASPASGERTVLDAEGGSGIGVRIDVDSVPVLEEAWGFVAGDIVPGGTRRNLASVSTLVDWSERISTEQQLVLADAQTSGGLLMAVDPAAAPGLLDDLHARRVQSATRIGTFIERAGRIEVT